jgi:lipopolysaccharide transport system ATP-binding protein
MRTAIRAEGLAKRYAIGLVRRERPDTLRELFAHGVRRVWSRAGRRARSDSIWALRDVSFQVQHAEVLGIIGGNGSGKSTLLKILSRITQPTAGRAYLYGRVASLLEVGTGFDRDLTGRENIYLSGAVLGMRRAEIRRKFDEIVAFAEVERFIDTPVKRYSSGMYVRLAFAVAAHLEPEILLVDEVLAVGDAQFQQKCLAKMHSIGQSGRTVLFVSHNMSAVTQLCQRAVLLDAGRLVDDGPPERVVRGYLRSHAPTQAAREWPDLRTAPGGEVARLCAVRVRTAAGVVRETVDIREPVGVEMEYEVLQEGRILMPSYLFFNEEALLLFGANHRDPRWSNRPRPRGRYRSTVWVPGNFFSEGRHFVDAELCVLDPLYNECYESRAVSFHVIEGPEMGAARGDWQGEMGGAVRPLLEWSTEAVGRTAPAVALTEALS